MWPTHNDRAGCFVRLAGVPAGQAASSGISNFPPRSRASRRPTRLDAPVRVRPVRRPRSHAVVGTLQAGPISPILDVI